MFVIALFEPLVPPYTLLLPSPASRPETASQGQFEKTLNNPRPAPPAPMRRMMRRFLIRFEGAPPAAGDSFVEPRSQLPTQWMRIR